ncbi:MAG: hypothetical protein ACFBSE_10940 [Prochloraceae cyanobacterium]
MLKKIGLISIAIICFGCSNFESSEDKTFKKILDNWISTSHDPKIKQYFSNKIRYKQAKKSALYYCKLKRKHGKEIAKYMFLNKSLELSLQENQKDTSNLFLVNLYIENSADLSYCPDK